MIEYSGPKLALFKFAHMSRTFVYGSLFIGLFAPWGSDWVYPVGLLALLVKLFVLVLIVTVVAATHARYRIDQAGIAGKGRGHLIGRQRVSDRAHWQHLPETEPARCQDIDKSSRVIAEQAAFPVAGQ